MFSVLFVQHFRLEKKKKNRLHKGSNLVAETWKLEYKGKTRAVTGHFLLLYNHINAAFPCGWMTGIALQLLNGKKCFSITNRILLLANGNFTGF